MVQCAARGEVVIVALSSGRIPWPIGRRRGTSARALIIYDGLAEAVKRESGIAIGHWFGVTSQTVTVWRKALDVGATNEGTSQLRSEWTETDAIQEGLGKGKESARDPERRRKIAESRKGKPRPAHVLKILARGRKRRNSPEARRKHSDTNKRRGVIPPAAGRAWTAEEDELVKALSVAEVAKATGRTLSAVYGRRSALGLPDGRARKTSR